MTLQGQAELAGKTQQAVLGVLADVPRWSDWVPGLTSVTTQGAHVRLTFADTLRSWVVVDQTLTQATLSLVLVEGSLTEFSVQLACTEAVVTLQATVRLKSTLPGPLRAELTERYPDRFLRALLSAA